MRVSSKKISRKGTYLGGGGMVDAMGVSMDLGCCGSGGLLVRGCWPLEMVVGVCVERFVIRVRNPRRLTFGADVSRARPNERQALDAVAVFAVVDAANRLHTGH